MKKIKILLLSASIIIAACSSKNNTDYVDTFIGTGGHGHTYPGVSMPFGMVQLSPDTRLTGWDGCSGYHYSDNIIYGFSHTHLSGTGCSDYGDIILMPTVGKIQLKNGYNNNPDSGYCSKFSHKTEKSSPGYYSVLLDDYNVKVELTATERAGFHKYIFPESNNSNIIIDLKNRDKVLDSKIEFINDSIVEGFRRSEAWAKDQYVYFAAKFSKPFKSYGIAVDDKIINGINEAEGKNIKAYVCFSTKSKEIIFVKVGISAVSTDGAMKNLEAEIPDWDFEKIKNLDSKAWNKELSKIKVEGGTKEQKTIFYTCLYHTLLSPNLFIDVDGKYRGTDLKIHQTKDFDNYTVFSLWDTFRAEHPLLTIIEPRRTLDFIKTFIAQYENGGQLPVWELAGNYTGCMIGYHSVPVIFDAYMKGIRSFDVEKAFEAMKHSAEQDHLGLKYYKKLGYIPADMESESVSKTLEYAYDDWCIAQMAKQLGKKSDYKNYIQRAQFYKNIFDKSTGFMRAKINGAWFTPFDPYEVNSNYTEANSWQYTFFVPQDIRGLIKLMGGDENFEKKLDELFSANELTTGSKLEDISGMIGQYAHGNEPSHHIAYLYDYVGKPWKTQKIVRQIMDKMYSAKPDGLCGNEDCGQMSAWFVFSAVGFYPVCPGQNEYAIGTPVFDKVTIDVGKGKYFIIKANNVSDKNIYIQSAELNGKKYNKSYLKHKDIMNGGEMIFEMGDKHNKNWANEKEDTPQSEITDNILVPVPYITSNSRTFIRSTNVSLACISGNTKIYYTLNGKEPTMKSKIYTKPIKLNKTTILKAFAFKEGFPKSFIITSKFNKIPEARNIKLKTSYSPQYSAGGDIALIDNIRGNKNFKTETWQGYEGNDLDAIIDLGSIKTLHKISTGFLQDINSWIFMPCSVRYSISNDGINFRNVANIKNSIPENKKGTIIKDFTKKIINTKARYIEVYAKNIGICPEWHKGAGEKAWIFADEIVVE